MKNLKYLAAIATLCAISHGVFAQGRVKEIRQMYADAQNQIKTMKEEPHEVHTLEVKYRRSEGGVGIVEETVTFYSILATNLYLNDAGDAYVPFFIRTKHEYKEALIGTTTSEYLYDTNTGSLVFSFKKTNGYEDSDDMYCEDRVYFNQDGTLCQANGVVKQRADNKQVTTFTGDENTAREEGIRYLELFNAVMNPAMVLSAKESTSGSPDLCFYDLNGPVKTLTYFSTTAIFSRNGRLISLDGAYPFRASGPMRTMNDEDGSFIDHCWLRRNDLGLICSEYFYESGIDYQVAPDGRKLSSLAEGEGSAYSTTYNYDIQQRLTSITEQEVELGENQEITQKIGSPTTITYTYSGKDKYGNWLTRKGSDGSEMTREIEYY